MTAHHKAVQKLLLSSVRERYSSAREVCHQLLQLPLNRETLLLSLDGSRVVLHDNLSTNSQTICNRILQGQIGDAS